MQIYPLHLDVDILDEASEARSVIIVNVPVGVFCFCRLFHIIPSVFPFELILLSTSSQNSIFVHISISLLDYSPGGETSHHALCLK